MKILIVDDDEVARISLSHILGQDGVQVVEAEDGESAWRMLEDGLRPAVCCSDVIMPRLDGIGLLQRARRHPVLKDLPFVLVSSAADRATVDAAFAGGVAGYILKPFLALQTKATVDRVMEERRTTRSEHFLVTRRRLEVSLERLQDMLAAFRVDAQSLAAALAAGSSAGEATVALRTLHESSLQLGLWKAASFLGEATADPVPPGDRVLAVREAALLAGEQLDDMAQLAPAH